MPDPISGAISYRDVLGYDPTEDLRSTIMKSIDERSYGPCAKPQGLLASVVCNDDVAISNTCRKAEPGTTTAYLCDDRKLQEAQRAVLMTTLDVLRNIIASALFGRVGK